MGRFLRKEEAPAERGVLFICEKCGKGADFSGKDLKNEVRSALKEKGQKHDLRIVLTSCLDLCPRDGIAVALAPTAAAKATQFFVASGRVADASDAIIEQL